jgi:hypothetical protein
VLAVASFERTSISGALGSCGWGMAARVKKLAEAEVSDVADVSAAMAPGAITEWCCRDLASGYHVRRWAAELTI